MVMSVEWMDGWKCRLSMDDFKNLNKKKEHFALHKITHDFLSTIIAFGSFLM
jgi:hypothetical protein